MDFKEIFDDNETQALIALNAQETMKQAVKKLFLVDLYGNGTLKAGKPADPLRNSAFFLVANMPDVKNEVIGENVRAIWQGVNLLENGFKKLSEFVPPVKAEKKPNQAR